MTTSYFANYKGDNGISIHRVLPVWYFGHEYKRLAPPNNLIWALKDGEITEEEFTIQYKEKVLNKINPQKLYDHLVSIAGEDAVLLTWTGESKFDYRYIVAEWFNEHLGTQITELQKS